MKKGDRRRKFYICDGMNDELYELCKDYLNCQMLSQILIELAKTVRKIEKRGNDTTKERDASGIFLVIDEFAALRIALIRKSLQKSNDSLRRIILMG